MKHKSKTEVLVVGAGPVGMMAALLLVRAGIDVQIIDEGQGSAIRSYACGIHPHSLSIMRDIGLYEQIEQAGRRIDKVAFYDHDKLRAELDLLQLPVQFPYGIVLPEVSLEPLLESQLMVDGKSRIQWNHRLSALRLSDGEVVATVGKLGVDSTGLVVEELERVVKSEMEISAEFVVGADGPNSIVRNSLGIQWELLGEGGMFIICDFKSDADFDKEVRILLNEEETEMLWPLGEHMGRWIVRTDSVPSQVELPDKNRMAAVVREPDDYKIRFQDWVQARTPWFTQPINEIDWLVELPFEPRLANKFGNGRCWLAGDSAHQSSPFGMQSMNVGLSEAVELAHILIAILRHGASPELLKSYAENHGAEWKALLSAREFSHTGTAADPWIKDKVSRIVPAIPASGQELVLLARQIGIDFAGARDFGIHTAA